MLGPSSWARPAPLPPIGLPRRPSLLVVQAGKRGKTPYQGGTDLLQSPSLHKLIPPHPQFQTVVSGNERVFGVFECRCGKRWSSGNSWANYGQVAVWQLHG
jgi:hypothetical protein